jgi:DNA-binding MarR family transcriptional regulator
MARRATPEERETVPVAPEVEFRHRLVKETADFAHAYLRWMDINNCDGISYPRLRLLEQLHCVGPDMMRALGEDLGLTPRNMTALVDSMEEEGLVARRAHPTDRRAVLVELTDDGLRAADALLEPRIKEMAALFDDLSPAEQKRFVAILTTLLDGLRRRGVRT